MNDYGVKRYPDYTELAYKEAVSKLRYFLAGNYAPSLRSYGGSASIKNLDESDADTVENKRYQPAPVSSAYGDFRTKPRPLTARYLNYYADSFKNNYGPGVTNAGSPTAATVSPERPSAGNPELVGFIQKQEEYIEQLERESQYCRDELNTLLGKVKEVISENEHLHEAQKDKLLSGVLGGGSDSDERDDMADSVGLDSDSKISPSKSRRSGRSSRLHGPNIVFESRISELEAQLAESKIELKKVQDENNENRRKLTEGIVDSSCLDGFKRQIENLQRDKTALELQVSKLKNSVESRQDLDKDIGSRLRREHEGLEQQLREERNNLEAEIRNLKEELNSQRGKVRELTGEGARRVMQERNMAERRYAAHIEEMTHDLAAQYDAVGKLQLELERQRREESDLKRELTMKNAGIEDLKNELKNKTASLQADIAQAQAEKSSMEEELANARLMMERQQRQAKHETNRLNSEIQSLRQRLERADADVVHARRENLRLSDQIANLEKELNMRNLRPTSPAVKDNKEKEFSNMIESMENKHGGAQSRADRPIRTQRGTPSSNRARPPRQKESDSSTRVSGPVFIGPLSTDQDLSSLRPGEKIFKLPLTIQQPFLHEKKEPIKVDISVKLVPKSRKKDRKKERMDETNKKEKPLDNRNVSTINVIDVKLSSGRSCETIEDVAKETMNLEALSSSETREGIKENIADNASKVGGTDEEDKGEELEVNVDVNDNAGIDIKEVCEEECAVHKNVDEETEKKLVEERVEKAEE